MAGRGVAGRGAGTKRWGRVVMAGVVLWGQVGPGVLAWAEAPGVPRAVAVVKGEGLIDRVPASAAVYAGFGGTGSAEWGDSKLGKVADSAAVTGLLEQTIPALIEMHDSFDGAAKYWQVLNLVRLVAGRPLGVYVVNAGPGERVPDLVAMIDGGEKADEFEATLREAMAGLWPDDSGKGHLSRQGRVMVFSAAGRAGAGVTVPMPLGSEAKFVEAMRTEGKPLVMAYADVGRIRELLSRAEHETPEGEQQKERATRLEALLGTDSLERFSMVGSIDGGGEYCTAVDVTFNRTPTGLVAELAGPGSSENELVARIPADAVWAATAEVKPIAVIEALETAVTGAFPDAGKQIQVVWGGLTAATGVRVKEDFLGLLGRHWAGYSTGDASQWVLLNRPENAEMAGKSLTLLVRAAQRLILMGAKGNPNPPRLEVTVEDVEGVRVTVAELKVEEQANVLIGSGASFAFAVKDGLLVLGRGKAGVIEALGLPAADIRSNPKYQEVMKRLGGPAGASFSFSDLPKTVAHQREGLLALLSLPEVRHFAGEVDVKSAMGAMYDAMEGQWSAGGEVRWADGRGYHVRTVAPFPGAEMLAGWDPGTATRMGVPAVAISVLLPSLHRARETANRVKSASNLRQIGQGIILYCNENGGKYPPSLGKLLLTEELGMDVFLSPRSYTGIPDKVSNGTPDQMAAWASADGDFEYLGDGLTSDAPAEVVVAHERLDRGLADGVNVLFADGHVEFVPFGQFEEVMAQSKAAREGKVGGNRP